MEESQFFRKVFIDHSWVIATIVIIIVVVGIVWYILSNVEPVLGSYTVSSGNIVSSIDIPGTVSSSNSVDLSFQESGQIAKVFVKEGDPVTSGEALASLDDSSQETALSQEKEALTAAQANYQKLLDGATAQSVQTSQDAVNSAQQNLTNAYSGAVNTLNSAYTAIYNAYDVVNSMQSTYFSAQDPEGGVVSGAKDDMNTNMQSAQSFLSAAEKSMAPADIDSTITQIMSALNNVYGDVGNVRTQCDQGVYYYNVKATDKSTLDAQKTTINTNLTSVTALQQSIASLKLSLKTAQDQLNVTTAPPTQAEIDLAKAQVASAETAIDNAKLVIDHATVTAPFSGIVRNVVAQPGMVVLPNIPVMSIINNEVMKIDAYASETDVTQIQDNGTANIVLDAYGDGVKFPAKVSAIDTSETTINGSPAYHITLYFSEADNRIRAGMTGNVLITAAEHDNVIEVPSQLILDDGGNDFVLIQNGKKNIRQKITIGLTGDDGMAEVISGLNGGEKISNY